MKRVDGGGDAEVRRQRQPEATADGCALDRRHDWRAGGDEPHGLLVERAGCPLVRRSAPVEGTRQVRAGAEVPSCRTEHDRPRVGIGVEALEGVGESGDQGGVEMVSRAAFELDGGDVVDAHFDADPMVHNSSRKCICMATHYLSIAGNGSLNL